MGAALKAVGDTGKILRHNPILLAGGMVLTVAFYLLQFVVGGILAIAVGWIPILGQLIQWVVTALILSAFIPGLIGMAYEGRNGNGGFGSFVSNATDGFVSYFGAYSIISVAYVALVIALVILYFVVGIGSAGIAGAGGGSAESFLATFGLMLVVFAVVGLLVAVVFFLIQFFDIAIVADGAGAVSSFSKSVDLVTSAPISVLGYSILRFLIFGVVAVLPYVFIIVLGSGVAGAGAATESPGAIFGAFSIVLLAAFAAWFLVILPLAFVVNFTYHAAFYNRHKALGNI